ncbi:16290_t:CDS:2 [Entrophospora sp. SA101]|nr:16290_t:CDS:2 [Entrophospora sp. SA101]
MTNDIVVGGYWLVEDKIGEAKHIITKELYALKREETIVYSPQLPDEYKFLKSLEGHDHIPKVYWYGEKLGWNCIVMDMLGPSLRMLSKAFCTLPVDFPDNFLLENNFPIPLDQLAEPNIFDLVNDSPRSKKIQMLVGRKYKTFLVDFGLAAYYIDQKTGKHIPKNKKMLKSKTGTARYASINVHKGYCHTRRDDMESLGYVFLEMLNGSLPWSGIRALSSQEGWAKMLKIKKDTSLVRLCKGCPTGFLKYLEHSELVAQEIEWFNGKQSTFTLGGGFSPRYQQNYDHISGARERSNSFTVPSRNDLSPSRPRTYSLPYKDPEHVDNNIQPNNYNNRNSRNYYLHKNHQSKKYTKGWFTPKNPVDIWNQQVANFENAWKEGRSWNGEYSLPCKEPIRANNVIEPENNHGHDHDHSSIHDDNQIKTTVFDVKDYNKQKWEQDMADILNAWRQGLTWDQDTTTDSQELNSTPKTEGKGKGRMNHNAEHEFQGFDGELQSSDHWINHMNNETVVPTDIESHNYHHHNNNNNGQFNARQRNQRNSGQLKRKPDPIDVKRSNAMAFRKSYDLYDSQSRQQSPLSASMSPKSSTIPNSAYSALVSPHYGSGYNNVNNNDPFRSKESIPNFGNNSNGTRLSKRSVPNLRDAVHSNNITPPLSATIKRTTNHMHDLQQVPLIDTRKQQFINSRCLPREFVEDKCYSNRNSRHPSQDSHFSFGRDDNNHRKRSSTSNIRKS